jgi:hypothetical protein
VPRASCEADGPEITCGVPQNDVWADASVGTWALTDFWHYFGTDRFALRWHRSHVPNQVLAAGSGGGIALVRPLLLIFFAWFNFLCVGLIVNFEFLASAAIRPVRARNRSLLRFSF